MYRKGLPGIARGDPLTSQEAYILGWFGHRAHEDGGTAGRGAVPVHICM